MRPLAALLVTLAASCAPLAPDVARAPAPDGDLPRMVRFSAAAAEPPLRSNAEIAQDFLDLTFRMESGRAVPALTRFEGPIRVRTAGPVPATLGADLDDLLGRLRREAGIDIARAQGRSAAITVEAVPSRRLQAAVPRAACFVVPRVSSWAEFTAARRTPVIDWTTLTRRDRAVIFVPADAAPQEIRDCLHEELAQALGPLNDLYRLPDSVFNDDNIHAVLTGFDMLILRAYYAPELANGMTRPEVARQLPGLLARLNPRGASAGRRVEAGSSGPWVEAIQLALAPGAPAAQRREAAARAIRMAEALGWGGSRAGFAHYAHGRLLVAQNPVAAQEAFRASARAYGGSTVMRIHMAHVAVQLAASALRAGDGEAVLRIVGPAIPVARRHENAALLATLLMFRAEGLALSGRDEAARAVRLDSLAWARYGFGEPANVFARQREIAALGPAPRT